MCRVLCRSGSGFTAKKARGIEQRDIRRKKRRFLSSISNKIRISFYLGRVISRSVREEKSIGSNKLKTNDIK